MKRYARVFTLLTAITLTVALAPCAVAQMAEPNRLTPGMERRPVGGAGPEMPQETAFTPGAAASGPHSQPRQENGVRETISGLREAGYTLDIIVGFLKTSGCQAAEVSMACLHAGFQGSDIVTALKNAGFSDRVAEDAVPRSLRSSVPADFPLSEQEIMAISSAVMSAATQGGDAVPLAIGQQSVLSRSRIARPSAAGDGERIVPQPRSDTGGFGGLGNWNRFQHERAKDLEHN